MQILQKGVIVWSFRMLVIPAAHKTGLYEPKASQHSVEQDDRASTPGLAI